MLTRPKLIAPFHSARGMASVSVRVRGRQRFLAQAPGADVDARGHHEKVAALQAGRQDRLDMLAAQHAAFGDALPFDAPVTIDGADMHDAADQVRICLLYT